MNDQADFRLFRIIGFELQGSTIVVPDAGKGGKPDQVFIFFLNRFEGVFQFFFEGKFNGLELERFVLFPADFYGFLNRPVTVAIQVDISGGDKDRDLNKGFERQREIGFLRIVGIDKGGFTDISLVSFRVDLKRYFSFPARGNRRIEIGDGAASAGSDAEDFQGFVPFVEDLEGMFQNRSFPDLFEVEFTRLHRYSGSFFLLVFPQGRVAPECQERKCHDDQKKFFHGFLLY